MIHLFFALRLGLATVSLPGFIVECGVVGLPQIKKIIGIE